MLVARKIFSILRHYWYVPVIIVGIIIFFVVFQKSPDSLVKILRNAREGHEKEVKKIQDIKEEQIAKQEMAVEAYQATMEKIEEAYDIKREQLSKKSQEKIKKIVKETKGNPEELTRRIAELTGFEIEG